MFFENMNIFLFLFFLIVWVLFLAFFWKKNYWRNSIIAISFLFLSFLFLLLTFFDPKISSHTISSFDSSSFVFLIDVSKSMNVEDIQYDNWNISRLEISKKLIQDFISKNPNNKYALCIFAWESLRVLPFTNDINLFSTFLDGITNKNISKNGTNFMEAFSSALMNFTWEEKEGTIITFTDGWDEKQDFDITKNSLKNKNINFLTIGVGTEKGWFIPTGVDMFWEKIYKLYNGSEVISKLEKWNISSIANNTEWKYDFLSSSWDFKNIENRIWESAKKILSSRLENVKSIKMECIIIWFLFFCLYLIFLFFAKSIWKRK
jgi:hypothetical protein